jgi:hypothetical protein
MHGQQSHTVFELLGGYHEARKLHEALTGLRKHVHDAYALSAAGGAELSPLRSAGDPVNFDRACSGKRAAATWSASNLRLPDPCRGVCALSTHVALISVLSCMTMGRQTPQQRLLVI